MSGVVHAVGKVFKGVVHAAKGVVNWIGDHWKTIAIAAAVVYAGGLASGAWGSDASAAAAEGGGAAAGEAGAEAATASMSDSGIVAGGGILAEGAPTISTSADTAASVFSAGGVAAGGGALDSGSIAAGGGILAENAPSIADSGTALSGTGGAFTAALGQYASEPNFAADQIVSGATSTTGSTWWDQSKSFVDNMRTDASRVKGNMFDGGAYTDYKGGVQTAAGTASNAGQVIGPSSVSGAATGGGDSGWSTLAKMQMASTVLKMVSGYYAGKAQYAPPRNFSGRGPGGGAGLGMHTSADGFSLIPGGQQGPSLGPPDALRANGVLPPQQSPFSLSDAGVASNSGSKPANIGQTVANQAGVGGLIPQGAVNYMGGGNNG